MAKRKSSEKKVYEDPPTTSGEYTVLARRYRPQQFADLVGQEAVAQALKNALESGRVAHAYLFTGARGVGKTSTARILAKALNCEKGPSASPCGKCEICHAITSGEDTDVLEIDGASNNSVENIRELRANVNFRPSRSRYKIYIIDEVHMLSTSAFNALLKTLEEPPPHVKFIFATTEVQKVPITILSRCQRFDFGGISIPGILERLKEIVVAENMEADDEALETIARRSGGSMRDAQSLLDQLLAFSGRKLTVDTVHQLLGTAHEERVTSIADAVLAKDTKKALEILSEIVNQGQQLGELLEQLIEYWRDMMIVNSAGIKGQSVSVSSARRGILEQHAKQANLDTILAGMDILVTAKSRLRFSSHTRPLMEMAVVRLCQLDDLLPIGQIAQLLAKDGTTPAARSAKQLPTAEVTSAEKKKATGVNGSGIATELIPFQEDTLPRLLQQLIETAGFALQADLRKVASTAISGPNALVFRVSRRYNTPGTLFADPVRLAKTEESLAQLTGQPCKIRIEWVDESAETVASGGKTASAAAMGQQRLQRAELLQIPFVKKVADVLSGQIIKADEGFGTAAKPAAVESNDSPEGE